MSPRIARRLLAFGVLIVAESIVFDWLGIPAILQFFLSMVGGGLLALSWHWREIRVARQHLRERRLRVGPPQEWID